MLLHALTVFHPSTCMQPALGVESREPSACTLETFPPKSIPVTSWRRHAYRRHAHPRSSASSPPIGRRLNIRLPDPRTGRVACIGTD